MKASGAARHGGGSTMPLLQGDGMELSNSRPARATLRVGAAGLTAVTALCVVERTEQNLVPSACAAAAAPLHPLSS